MSYVWVWECSCEGAVQFSNTGNPGMDTLLSTVDRRMSTLDRRMSTVDRRVSKLRENI